VAVPATASPAPGCTRPGHSRVENTRPRSDRCSAHRVRPDRPHRPRSRPVSGRPLRQLASDPFHPVEGGSANAYDYAWGDPVNRLDLAGREATPGPGVTTCVHLQPYIEEVALSPECFTFRETHFRASVGLGPLPPTGGGPSGLVTVGRAIAGAVDRVVRPAFVDHGIEFSACWYVCAASNPATGADISGVNIGPSEGANPSSKRVRAGLGASATTTCGGDPHRSHGLVGCYYLCLGGYHGPDGPGFVVGAGTPGAFLC
jgi:hypothetical protein